MFVCPLCRLVVGDNETTCPRDGHEAAEARRVDVPRAVRARFAIVEAYAQGDAGDLYLADDQQTGRRGVLKLLRPAPNATPAEKARLKRELVKLSTLTHPSLSVPLATGEEDGALWLFREWHEGVSLRVKLTRGGALPIAEALSIASQLAAALDELHRSGLLHRDVKPGHVLINPQPSGLPRVTLIDAGIAGRIETGAIFDVMGTPEYASPEQVQGKLVSFRTDLYALGCVLFEMLTGTPPFSGTPAELLAAHAAQPAPTPQLSMPTGISTLLAQLLAKEPRERPFSAQQVRRTLEPFLPQSPNPRREATQTFERLSEKRRAPVTGRGTLRPPSATKIGMPAAVPPPSAPPSAEPSTPPGPVANRSADPTEELSALDLEEAESIVAQAAAASATPPATAPRDRTMELSALDLEQAEQALAVEPAEPSAEPAPPWEQVPIADEAGDDPLADAAADTVADGATADPTMADARTAQDGARASRAAPPRAAAPRKRVTGPTLAFLAGVCGIVPLVTLGAVWLLSDADPSPAAAGSAPVAEPSSTALEPADGSEPPLGVAPPAAPGPSAASAPPAAPADEETDAARLERFNAAREEALAHFRARRFDQAAAAYQRATELDSQHAGSFSGLGAARLAQGQAARAVRAYRRAVALQPEHAGYHAALGQAYAAAGEGERARRSFTRALELDPGNRAAREGLAR